MSKRKLVRRLAVFFAVLVTPLVAIQSPALATDYSFHARYAHAGGTGALAVEIRGGIVWHARSVTLTAVEMWVKGGECAELQIMSFQGTTYFKNLYKELSICNTGSSKWYGWGNVGIDASHIEGGITRMWLTAYDGTHNGQYTDEVYR